MHSVKAFRGTRRSSIYREFVLADEAFDRIVEALGRQDIQGELDKEEARRLAEELGELRTDAALPELDDHLTAIAELARWCSRATGGSWLRIGPRAGV
jgi:hypothetical protein